MNRRDVTLRLLELTRGAVEGTLDRPALLRGLTELYGALGGDQADLKASLPSGTQLAILGEQGVEQAAQRRATATAELRQRAERIVRYWIVRTGRDPRRTEVSDDRVRKVAKVLKTKTDEEAMQAVANVADSEFHAGENDRGNRYDTIDVIFGRGIEKFEHHRDSGDAPVEVDSPLDDTVGRKPARPAMSRAELEAKIAEAVERKKRAQRGGDRDAFNRWAAEERRLRREVGKASSRGSEDL